MRSLARRWGRVTRRQRAALVLVTAIGATITVSALAGQMALATALLGPMGILITLGLIQVRRRVAALSPSIRRCVAEVVQREANWTRAAITEDIQARSAATTRQVREAERRLLAAVDRERTVTGDRYRSLLTALERSDRSVVSAVERLQRQQTREVEALLQLFRGFEPRAPMPSSGGWALDPTGLLQVLSLVERGRPKTVLELGSGVSSVWLAYALEKSGGRLVTIDHEQKYAERTSSLLSLHGLDHVVEIRVAALHPINIAGTEFRWYDPEAFADLSDVDLLLVDGPPGATGPVARYPALPVLEDKLSASATVVLDDAQRPDEQEVVRRWTETFTGLVRQDEVVGRQAVMWYARVSTPSSPSLIL